MDLLGLAKELGIEVQFVKEMDGYGEFVIAESLIRLLEGEGWEDTLAHELWHCLSMAGLSYELDWDSYEIEVEGKRFELDEKWVNLVSEYYERRVWDEEVYAFTMQKEKELLVEVGLKYKEEVKKAKGRRIRKEKFNKLQIVVSRVVLVGMLVGAGIYSSLGGSLVEVEGNLIETVQVK